MTYGYDAAGRVVSRGGTLFQSILPTAVTSGSYNANNQLTAWTTATGGVSPTYDLNGNLTNDGTRAFSWDARNRLISIASGPSFVDAEQLGGTVNQLAELFEEDSKRKRRR